MMKFISLFLILIFSINNAYCSSAMYSSIKTGEHFSVKNQASGDEAEPKARKYCEDEYGIGNCKLVYKTDYGGYGTIAIGGKSNGYSYGIPTQELADKGALRACEKNSKPKKSCYITSRWKDEGKRVYYKEYSNDGICGVNPANGMPISCATGTDQLGNYKGYNNGQLINPSTGQPARY